MYRSGPRIACGTCAPRVGALHNGVYSYPGLPQGTPADPGQTVAAMLAAAAKARAIAQGPELPGSSLSDRYRDTLIAIYSELRESGEAADWLESKYADWWLTVRQVPEMRAALEKMAADIEVASRVATAMEAAFHNESARNFASWQAAYGDWGDFREYAYNKTIGWLRERPTVAKETFYDPVAGDVKDVAAMVADALKKAAEDLKKSSIAAWVLPIAGITLVAYFALKR